MQEVFLHCPELCSLQHARSHLQTKSLPEDQSSACRSVLRCQTDSRVITKGMQKLYQGSCGGLFLCWAPALAAVGGDLLGRLCSGALLADAPAAPLSPGRGRLLVCFSICMPSKTSIPSTSYTHSLCRLKEALGVSTQLDSAWFISTVPATVSGMRDQRPSYLCSLSPGTPSGSFASG